MTDFCQCEHQCHPNSDDASNAQLQRRDAPDHVYGTEVFADTELSLVHTLYGDYKICQACMQDHPIPKEYLK